MVLQMSQCFMERKKSFSVFFLLLPFLIQTLQMEKAGVNRMNSFVALPGFFYAK